MTNGRYLKFDKIPGITLATLECPTCGGKIPMSGDYPLDGNIESKGTVSVPGMWIVWACRNPTCKWSKINNTY